MVRKCIIQNTIPKSFKIWNMMEILSVMISYWSEQYVEYGQAADFG